MNTENQTDSPPAPVDPGAIPSPRDAISSTWRHNGKVARLPKALRDKINVMLQEGATYPAILAGLGDAGKDLNPMNLSRWKDSGHQNWLLEQTWLAHTCARQDPAADLSSDFDATQEAPINTP